MLPRFNSRWLCPGTEAVDSLKLADSAWAEETNWCNPPWPLLPSLVAKLRSSQARAAVVAPYWPSALWRPVLLEYSDWVVDLAPRPGLFVSGRAAGVKAEAPAPRWRTQVFLKGVQPPPVGGWVRAVRPANATVTMRAEPAQHLGRGTSGTRWAPWSSSFPTPTRSSGHSPAI